MKRRDWLAAATTMLASAAKGQPRPRRVSIGWLASVPIRRWPPYPAFVEAMRERGWVEGTHYVVDEASYDGQAARNPQVVPI